MDEARQKIAREYESKHTNCPKCRSNDIATTCVGVGLIGDYRDTNRATCQKCGWIGIVDDLVSEQGQ